MSTWPATKKCSHCRETGRPSHCAMCVARNIIDDLECQLVEAQKKLDAVRTQAAGTLECAANDLEALAEGVEFERGENAPWALVRKSIGRILKEGAFVKTHAKCDLCANGVLLVGGGLQRCPKEGE